MGEGCPSGSFAGSAQVGGQVTPSLLGLGLGGPGRDCPASLTCIPQGRGSGGTRGGGPWGALGPAGWGRADHKLLCGTEEAAVV